MSKILRCIVVAGAATVLCAEFAHAQQADGTEDFVPGELLVGFSSQQDRDSLAANLSQNRQSLRAGGEAPAAIVTEPQSRNTVKLKIDFSANTRNRLRNTPSSELPLLQEMAAQIKANNSGVSYAHPNWVVRLDPVDRANAGQLDKGALSNLNSPEPNDPIYQAGLQWHYGPLPGGMNAEAAWSAGIKGDRDIVVAVLDTGMVFNHEDTERSPNLKRGVSMLSYNICTEQEIPRQGDATDTGDACPQKGVEASSWHGSHVAGIIGAVGTNNRVGTAGINWNITVVPVRVLGPVAGTAQDIADGIRWAAGLPVQGVSQRIEKKADIINMSLGGRGPCSDQEYGIVRDAISAARAQGTVVVISAGNGSYFDNQGKSCKPGSQNCSHRQEDVTLYRPASCPGAISVSASGPTGALAPYSNFGNTVSIMAPGGDGNQGKEFDIFGQKRRLPLAVWSIGNPNYYYPMQGTSQAAPHVAGAIALAMSKDPSLRGKPDEVARRLRASAVPVQSGACPPGKPCGAGQLDVMKLINQR